MSDPVGNDLNSEALGVGNRLLPALAVGHYARKLKSLRDPAAIFFNLQVNRQPFSSSYSSNGSGISRIDP